MNRNLNIDVMTVNIIAAKLRRKRYMQGKRTEKKPL